MNSPRLIPLLLLVLCLSGCDKVKEVTQQAMAKVNKGVKERLDSGDEKEKEKEKVDSSLMALVDENEEGVVFRKDLPFPGNIRVISRSEHKIAGRVVHVTEAGSQVQELKGSQNVVTELERNGATVRYSMKKSGFSAPAQESQDGNKEAAQPFGGDSGTNSGLTFVQRDGVWGLQHGGDFRLMALSQQLSPVFNDLLVDNALMPRPLWFSKQRLKIGDELEVSGPLIPMLVAGEASGSLKLRLEAIEPVQGHPCGRFSVAGRFSRRGFPDFDGSLTDQEVTIESGSLWLSLVHPVILRQQLKTIQTFKPTGDGGPVGRGQGAIESSVELEWSAPSSEAGAGQ